MNILFVTDNEISPLQGGTERITHTLAKEFLRSGHSCYSLFAEAICGDFPKSEFNAKQQINYTNAQKVISDFYEKNKISHVIVNLVKYKNKKLLCPIIYETAHSKNIKVVCCYHAMPGEDFIGASLHNSVYKLFHRYQCKQAVKDIILKLVPSFIWRGRAKRKYAVMPNNCDKFVLLSSNFYTSYAWWSGINDFSKWENIPNALSFSEFLSVDQIGKKEKEVLIIARLDEVSKRLSLAMEVWREIEKNPALNDWKLTIIGGGADEQYYRSIIHKYNLSRCSLLGRQKEIIPFYKKAAIFMMTSAYEGFGITLIEAQQMGVVPIAFNSYASLQDIVMQKENGVIVQNNNVQEYVKELTHLMTKDEYRFSLAERGLETCKRFQQSEITERWLNLLENLDY